VTPGIGGGTSGLASVGMGAAMMASATMGASGSGSSGAPSSATQTPAPAATATPAVEEAVETAEAVAETETRPTGATPLIATQASAGPAATITEPEAPKTQAPVADEEEHRVRQRA
jgi:hypothetical protein